ncbi:MAG: DUF6933 domain-containing protein [Acidimicrobiales bacterium]
MILRCTRLLLDVLGPGCIASPAPQPDLEDFYANLVSIERRKCLLLTHAATLFSVFVPDVRAPELRATKHLVTRLITGAIVAEDLPVDTFGDLLREELIVAKTADRRVLGCTNDLAFLAGLGSPVDTHDGYQDFDAPMLRCGRRCLCTARGRFAYGKGDHLRRERTDDRPPTRVGVSGKAAISSRPQRRSRSFIACGGDILRSRMSAPLLTRKPWSWRLHNAAAMALLYSYEAVGRPRGDNDHTPPNLPGERTAIRSRGLGVFTGDPRRDSPPCGDHRPALLRNQNTACAPNTRPLHPGRQQVAVSA